ncbi:RcnB family protein [Acinetobacter sp. MB5]|uniref:RcnB family protein n=1 Tax=Acinetobacter sp. MB5 TaxID=2069438 RepID=UPI000DD009BF|nr:RcnB family protein [Acinetobacter sp. MB5]
MRKSKWMAAALAVSTSLASGLTLADPWDHDDRRGPPVYYEHHYDHGWDGPRHHWRDHPVRYWHEGEYIPRDYMDDHYYVDWHEEHLPPPPYGHRWMRIDGDFVLVAVASSIITQILLGPHFH